MKLTSCFSSSAIKIKDAGHWRLGLAVEGACLFSWVRVLMCMFVISAVLYMSTRFTWCLVECEISRGARKLPGHPRK
jgi:hypothetical protein